MVIKSGLQRLLVAGILAVMVLPWALACGGGDDDEDQNAGAAVATTAPANSNSDDSDDGDDSDGGEAQTVSVIMKDNVFEPDAIEVSEGTVTFELKNEGTAIHNMHILSKTAEGKDFMSKTTINGGESDTFTATFTKGGTIKFQCDFHVPDMAGTITVN